MEAQPARAHSKVDLRGRRRWPRSRRAAEACAVIGRDRVLRPLQMRTQTWHVDPDLSGTDSTDPDPDRGQVEELVQRSARWLVLASIGSRMVLTIPAATLNRGVLGDAGNRELILAGIVLIIDGLLMVGLIRRPGLLSTRWLFTADIVFAIVVTVIATLAIPPGAYLKPGPDALTGYGWGTVCLWTAARGWRVGVWMVGGFLTLQLSMAVLNDATFDVDGIGNVAGRVSFAATAFLVAAGLTILARRGARLVIAQGLRAGRFVARAEELRAMHDTALADLEAVVLLADRATQPVATRWNAIAAVAFQRSHDSAADDPDMAAVNLSDRLDDLVTEFRSRSLSVERDGVVSSDALTENVAGLVALVGSAREALNNVAKHAGVDQVQLRVTTSEDDVGVEIIDKGSGFDLGAGSNGHGVRHSIIERMSDAGGHALVTSSSARGTRVLLQVPRQPGADEVVAGETVNLIADRAMTGFPLLALAWRILNLPVIAIVVGAFIPDNRGVFDLLIVGLLAANLVLAAVLIQPGGLRLLHSYVLLAVDLAVGAALFLWTATLVEAGTIVEPNPDNAWTYIMATVTFWFAARGSIVGSSVLIGGLLVGAVAMMINGVVVGPDNGILVLDHVVLLLACAISPVLVIRMARRGGNLAIAESQRAGREAERVEILGGLRARILNTWELMASMTCGVPSLHGLAEVRGLALGAAEDLRSGLHIDRAARGLVAELQSVTAAARRRGLRVELVVTELAGDPPADVIAAVSSACTAALPSAVEAADLGTTVLMITGSSTAVDATLRDHVTRAAPPDEETIAAAMESVGGTASVRAIPGRGTRVRLSWSLR